MLILAIDNKQIALIPILLQYGPDLLTTATPDGNTALQWTVAKGNTTMLTKLLEEVEKRPDWLTILKTKNNKKKTPYQLAEILRPGTRMFAFLKENCCIH